MFRFHFPKGLYRQLTSIVRFLIILIIFSSLFFLALQFQYGLDPDEKRFKKRLEASARAIDDAFEDADDDDDIELNAKEIEQLNVSTFGIYLRT